MARTAFIILSFTFLLAKFGVVEENWNTLAIESHSKNFKNQNNRIDIGKTIFHLLPINVTTQTSDNLIQITNEMNYKLSKNSIFRLLGKPNEQSSANTFSYFLGHEKGASHSLLISFSSNIVSGSSIVTTK